jgi:hypothetical protein
MTELESRQAVETAALRARVIASVRLLDPNDKVHAQVLSLVSAILESEIIKQQIDKNK